MSPAHMAKIEIGIRLALEFAAAANAKDAGRISALFEADGLFCAEGPAPRGKESRGREEIRRYFEARFAAAPGERFEIEEALGFGYRCVLRWKLEGAGVSGLGEGGEPLRGAWLFTAGQEGIRELHGYRKA